MSINTLHKGDDDDDDDNNNNNTTTKSLSTTDVVPKTMNTSSELHNLQRCFYSSFQRAAVLATVENIVIILIGLKIMNWLAQYVMQKEATCNMIDINNLLCLTF